MANRRTRGTKMRAHDHANKLDRGVGFRMIRMSLERWTRATNMVLAAQAQDAVVPSPDSSGCVRGTGPPSGGATGGVEDGRSLLERGCSSRFEDMGER
jgi:hypothetical protein